MVNYFDSIKLYSWKMDDEQVQKFEKKLDKLEWKMMLFIHLTLASILAITINLFLKNLSKNPITLMNTIDNSILIGILSNVIIGILFIFGGYYFTKLFFETKLSLTKFYTILAYLTLPLLGIYILINLSIFWFSVYFGALAVIGYLLYIPIAYYALKQLNTTIYLFRFEFNTSSLKLAVVVFLWGIITGTVYTFIITGFLLFI